HGRYGHGRGPDPEPWPTRTRPRAWPRAMADGDLSRGPARSRGRCRHSAGLPRGLLREPDEEGGAGTDLLRHPAEDPRLDLRTVGAEDEEPRTVLRDDLEE